jgi:hypothetical protein
VSGAVLFRTIVTLNLAQGSPADFERGLGLEVDADTESGMTTSERKKLCAASS